jgi:pyridoxine 5-phosphate synthase
MRTTALSVNVNLVAQIRNRRNLPFPSVVRAAEICLQSGAAGITVHPRPDERHIRAHDVADLAALMKAWPHREFNIEGNPFQNLMGFVREFKPHQCTFVPDSEAQPTSDHGWDLRRDGGKLRPLIDEAKRLGVRVSLFMDAVPQNMALAKTLGADRVELYTEPFAAAWLSGDRPQIDEQTRRFAHSALAATQAGLGINAGHDLNRDNLAAFIRGVPGVREVSIGHALMSDALELGYVTTVKAYLACIEQGSQA